MIEAIEPQTKNILIQHRLTVCNDTHTQKYSKVALHRSFSLKNSSWADFPISMPVHFDELMMHNKTFWKAVGIMLFYKCAECRLPFRLLYVLHKTLNKKNCWSLYTCITWASRLLLRVSLALRFKDVLSVSSHMTHNHSYRSYRHVDGISK